TAHVLVVGERLERAGERCRGRIAGELLEDVAFGVLREPVLRRVDAERELAVVAELELRLDDRAVRGSDLRDAGGEADLRRVHDREIAPQLGNAKVPRFVAGTGRERLVLRNTDILGRWATAANRGGSGHREEGER